MILGNQVEWAIHCMSVLGRMPEQIIPAKLLAEFHGVPKEYLSKAMQSLSQAKLVHTTSGPKGGYQLTKSPEKITMLDIVEAVEGKKLTFNCQEIRKNNPCQPGLKKMKLPVCSVAAVMYEADNAWREVLKNKTLQDIISDVKRSVDKNALSESDQWFVDGLN